MKSAARRLLHASHAWAGAVFGLALFIVCLSGVWAVADAHLRYWEAGARRPPPPAAVDIDRMLVAARAQLPPDARQISIALPTALHPVVTVSSGPSGPGGPPRRISLDPATAGPVPDATGSAAMAPIVTTLHKSLYAGFPGRIAVSLMGVALTVLLLGGIALHPRRWRDWTALRWARGWRAAAFDLHKLLGLWLLPVLLLIAVTGIFSGLGALGTMALSRLAYAGGMPEALAELTGRPPERASGVPATLPPLQALLDAHRLRDPGLRVESITLANAGDTEATLTLAGTRAGLLSTAVFERAHYRVHDGLLLREDSVRGRGGWLRAFAAVQPLHYAQYGGCWGLALHLVGGLGAAALAATGTLLWLGRRAAQGGSWLAERLVAGIGGGLAVACAALLLAAAGGLGGLGVVFWGGWGLAAAGLALARRQGCAAALASALAGGLLLGAAGIDLARSLAQPLAVAAPALRIDAFLFCAGAVLLALGLRFHFRSEDSP
jgi:uncharacterized iron-regulated membrane protein